MLWKLTQCAGHTSAHARHQQYSTLLFALARTKWSQVAGLINTTGYEHNVPLCSRSLKIDTNIQNYHILSISKHVHAHASIEGTRKNNGDRRN